jgi:hypothetical protein
MEDLILILLGLVAVLFQCLAALNSRLQDARAANINFNAKKDYWQRDAVPIMLAVIPVFIWYFVFGEVAARSELLANLKRLSFVLIGGIGSWLLQLLLGTSKKVIRNIVDRKTNELNQLKGLPDDHKTNLPPAKQQL